jgi:hypothetical protein
MSSAQQPTDLAQSSTFSSCFLRGSTRARIWSKLVNFQLRALVSIGLPSRASSCSRLENRAQFAVHLARTTGVREPGADRQGAADDRDCTEQETVSGEIRMEQIDVEDVDRTRNTDRSSSAPAHVHERCLASAVSALRTEEGRRR